MRSTSRRPSRSRGGEEPAREIHFTKNDMSRDDDDVVGQKVETPVPLVVRGVLEEKAASGSRRKFMHNQRLKGAYRKGQCRRLRRKEWNE